MIEYRVNLNAAMLHIEVLKFDSVRKIAWVSDGKGGHTEEPFKQGVFLPGPWMKLTPEDAEGMARALAEAYRLRDLDSIREIGALKYHLEDMRCLVFGQENRNE